MIQNIKKYIEYSLTVLMEIYLFTMAAYLLFEITFQMNL